MNSEKELALLIFNKFLDNNLSNNIEKELFNYSNNNIKDYISKLKYLFELINPQSELYNQDLVNKINTGKITSYDLINMNPWELCAIVWKDILEEQSKNDKIIIDKTPTYTTDQFVCTKCKNNKCKTYSLQTRSADEPMTIFVNCITCDNTWRMS